MTIRPAFVAIAFAALPLPGLAEVDLGAVSACGIAGDPPAACVEQAMAECHAAPPDTPAVASQCFRAAQARFSEGITARMQAIRDGAPERIAAIAGIEVKYDLLLGLTQCDRMQELALVGESDLAAIQRQADGCTATAAGIALLRLMSRSRDLPL